MKRVTSSYALPWAASAGSSLTAVLTPRSGVVLRSTTMTQVQQQRLRNAWNFAGTEIVGRRLLSTNGGDKDDKGTKEKTENAKRSKLVVGLIGAGLTGSALWWAYYALDLKSRIDNFVKNKWDSDPYIYPIDPAEVRAFIKKHCLDPLAYRFTTTRTACELMAEFKAGGTRRDIAIDKLATMENLSDNDCVYFAMYTDLATALALANNGADPRLFPPPTKCTGPKKYFRSYFGGVFRNIIDPLPANNIHENLHVIYMSSIKSYLPSEDEATQKHLEMYSGFEDQPNVKIHSEATSEQMFLKVCLQTLISHTRDPSHLPLVMKTKGELLDVLVVICQMYDAHPEIISLVMKVLANLSCDQSFAEDIRSSGCLKLLVEASHSENIHLELPARRALHNLDRESGEDILPSGVYQLYPKYRIKGHLSMDIVCIHGVLGGAFRTWRKQDEVNETAEDTEPEEVSKIKDMSAWVGEKTVLASKLLLNHPVEPPEEVSRYKCRTENPEGGWIHTDDEVPLCEEHVESIDTQCWPKDWLPEDCPKARILAVDYDSFVTYWSNFCPVETVKRSLHERSSELLQKLHSAGVGRRPVVWVTHSMGGLLAKGILCESAESNTDLKSLAAKTRGVIFCSVPHFGSYITLASATRRMIFMPTIEAMDLTNSEGKLTLLNERFKKLADEHNYKTVSFVEKLETKSMYNVAFKMVPFSSADPGFGEFYPINLDHLNTCKPHCRGSIIYRKIVELIHKVDAILEKEEVAKQKTGEGVINKDNGKTKTNTRKTK